MLTRLADEHRFVSASIQEIKANHRIYQQQNSVDSVVAAMSQLQAEKIILEAKIHVLSEFLNG